MAKKFFWIDMEMTGLDERIDSILEVAVIITDLQFNPVETYHRIVYQPAEVLAGMNAWCQKAHKESGLVAKVPGGTPLEQVERDLVGLIEEHFGKEEVVLAGNSVGNDRRFVDKYLPLVAGKLHYRLIDVSSFKEVFREKYGIKFDKISTHRALADIQESINELKMYLAHVHIDDKAKA